MPGFTEQVSILSTALSLTRSKALGKHPNRGQKIKEQLLVLPQMYHLPLSLYFAFPARCFVAGEMLSGACYHPTPRARLAELLL